MFDGQPRTKTVIEVFRIYKYSHACLTIHFREAGGNRLVWALPPLLYEYTYNCAPYSLSVNVRFTKTFLNCKLKEEVQFPEIVISNYTIFSFFIMLMAKPKRQFFFIMV
jgi:hypothetical protein